MLYASRVAGQHRKRNVRQCQLPVPESDRRSLEKAGPRPFRRSGAPTRPPLRTKSDCSQARVLAMIRVIRGRVRSVWRPPSRPSHHRPLMARLRCGDGPGPARGPSLSPTHPGAGRTALSSRYDTENSTRLRVALEPKTDVAAFCNPALAAFPSRAVSRSLPGHGLGHAAGPPGFNIT